MSGIGTGYDLSATTYSPDGKVFQTEYAQKAVDGAGTVIGLRCKDGVVLAVEKLVISKLLVEGSNKRIFNVDKHAGVATAGLAPDGRMIASRASEECAGYKKFYGEPIPGHVLCDRVAGYVHMFSLYWAFRPYGATLLIGTYDKSAGPQLHVIDPSGTAFRFVGAAIGKGRQLARNEIEKLKLSDMTCREAVVEAVKILHKVHDEESKPFEIEMSWICDETGREHQKVPTDLLLAAEVAAKAAMRDDDMDD